MKYSNTKEKKNIFETDYIKYGEERKGTLYVNGRRYTKGKIKL